MNGLLKNKWVKFGAIALIVAVAVIALKKLGIFTFINGLLDQAILWVDSLGTWGIIAFIGIYVLASVMFVSGAALTLGAGALFGVVQGSILVSIASTLAATCSFLIGRYIARDWVSKQIDSQPKFRAVDKAVAQEGWKIVGLVRLSPIFPFVFLNYAFGVTKVTLREYVVASWIGMMPGTVMYVYFGYIGRAAANAASADAAGGQEALLKTALTIVGLIATVVVTVLITKAAQKALDAQIDEDGSDAIPQGSPEV
ncbi:SNARE associated Golgi-related protein [[Leptolyngbya] sp. PCC 7376]|uniref:TVP38/TMEM64 family protein n=1 Tax=[Leptolyngbya] sp. PCC 7376 TaxID=111781 RepID=UPI00029F20BF|nr:TVP38/TMEM64 family protein [[Leptolyngbya] sp. PCC 7376]AFY40456.1 SNARE associated Golgi-related protein [[Leptolyngbya] sp. PCC 7376]